MFHSLKYFATMSLPNVKFLVISESPTSYYSGSIPATIAGLYEPNHALLKLRGLVNWAGMSFIKGKVTRIDPKQQVI